MKNLEITLGGVLKGIRFIDRALKKEEKTHYQCRTCGAYISHDLVYFHYNKCSRRKQDGKNNN